MITLGIETSCDETSAAVVNDDRVLSNLIATQFVHEEYGGVVPEFASRAHIRTLMPIISRALEQADVHISDIDGIAVTQGPGLAGSLLVGVCVAKGLALSLRVPFIGVNHIEGHIVAVAASEPHIDYPYIALVASGGHSMLVYIERPFSYQLIGQTLDDAAGEAFDKVAKVLALGYPGGPAVEKAAQTGDPAAVPFPRALMEKDNFNFSFSGLKTAVLYHVRTLRQQNAPIPIADITASFQRAVVDVLLEKTMRAVSAFNCRHLVLAGGVIRNSALRAAFETACAERGIRVRIPTPLLCTDNAGMIARAGHFRLAAGQSSTLDLDVAPNLRLTDMLYEYRP